MRFVCSDRTIVSTGGEQEELAFRNVPLCLWGRMGSGYSDCTILSIGGGQGEDLLVLTVLLYPSAGEGEDLVGLTVPLCPRGEKGNIWLF